MSSLKAHGTSKSYSALQIPFCQIKSCWTRYIARFLTLNTHFVLIIMISNLNNLRRLVTATGTLKNNLTIYISWFFQKNPDWTPNCGLTKSTFLHVKSDLVAIWPGNFKKLSRYLYPTALEKRRRPQILVKKNYSKKIWFYISSFLICACFGRAMWWEKIGKSYFHV